MNTSSKNHNKKITAALLCLAVILCIALFTACTRETPADIDWALPSLHISTELDPFDIERDLWHEGTIALAGATEAFAFEAVDARFRGRGNSTWWLGPDKRPLRFRLEEPMSLMGSAAVATDWILLANHFDRSLLRNYAAFHLAGQLDGLDFTPVPHHMHLYVNGEYMGVYLLTDERDVLPGRMELQRNQDSAPSDVFLELDLRAPDTGVENETFVMVNGLPYDVRWPGSSHRTPEFMAYVREHLETVRHTIRHGSFDEVSERIDLDSFIDFYIVQELFNNSEVFILSVFLHIRGEGDARRLYMGPVWDFDTAAGNRFGQPLGHGPEYLYAAVFNYWYRALLEMPEFFDAVVARWNEVRYAQIAETIAHVHDIATRYQADFERNFERHPVMGVPIVQGTTPEDTIPELLEINSFLGHAEHLITFLEARASWLDDFFNGRLPGHDPLQTLVRYHTYHRPLSLVIDGEYHPFAVPPIMLQYRVMLPLWDLAEALDLTATHDSATDIVTLERGATAFTHQIGTPFFAVNGVEFEFGTPSSLVIGGHIFLPLHIIATTFGFETDWEVDTRTVTIRTHHT
jgi:hypothetical protein